MYDEARKRGAYLRPLGNTVYVCPPLQHQRTELEELLAIFEESGTGRDDGVMAKDGSGNTVTDR